MERWTPASLFERNSKRSTEAILLEGARGIELVPKPLSATTHRLHSRSDHRVTEKGAYNSLDIRRTDDKDARTSICVAPRLALVAARPPAAARRSRQVVTRSDIVRRDRILVAPSLARFDDQTWS